MKINSNLVAMVAAALFAYALFQPVMCAHANGNIAVGSDGYTRLLWTNWSGQADLWELNSSLGLANSVALAPISGWTARAIAVDGSNQTHLLWTNSNGAADIWILNSSLSLVSDSEYPPVTDWTARDVAADGSGNTYLLWTKTDATAAVWKLNSSLELSTYITFPSISGFSPRAIASDSSGNARLMWNNWDGGEATIYLMNSSLSVIAQTILTPDVQVADSISAGPSGKTYVLWAGGGPTIQVLNSSLAQIASESYTAPAALVKVDSLTVDGSGNCYMDYASWSNQATVQSINSSLNVTNTQSFGPYTGWAISILPTMILQ